MACRLPFTLRSNWLILSRYQHPQTVKESTMPPFHCSTTQFGVSSSCSRRHRDYNRICICMSYMVYVTCDFCRTPVTSRTLMLSKSYCSLQVCVSSTGAKIYIMLRQIEWCYSDPPKISSCSVMSLHHTGVPYLGLSVWTIQDLTLIFCIPSLFYRLLVSSLHVMSALRLRIDPENTT